MMKTALPLLLLLTIHHVAEQTEAAADDQPSCGFSSCHAVKEGYVNVHMVPHSHDDLGWHKTVDEYFYGWNNEVQNANVSRIIDSVFEEVSRDPAKRYIQVETAFLWMWWQRQNDTTRQQYRQLVQSGQIQITGGGWSMPDEATTNYQSLIDNFSWGFKFLNDSFGACGIPNVGWQIDPFGHSKETASIMAAMGFQGTFLNRIDYQDYYHRRKKTKLEFIWHTSENLGASADLFTNILYGGYTPPLYCCWDMLCGVADITDDDDVEYQNYIVNIFTAYVDKQVKNYKTKNVLITMGSDFTYMNAPKFYSNMDKIISLINKKQKNGGKLNLLYSTPSCYLKAVHDAQPNISTKTDDFLPYASEENAYWTGFYTSRPTIKYLERFGHNFLQVSKQLSVLAGLSEEQLQPLNDLRGIMGVLQHHDAITGTERSHVAKDYVRTFTRAVDGTQHLVKTALNTLLSPDVSADNATAASMEMKSCLLLNISQCEVSEQNENFIVTVYNPLSRAVSHYVRLPVKDGTYSVTDMNGTAQLVQIVAIPTPVLKIRSNDSDTKQTLVFRAIDIPPLGLRSYKVTRTSTTASISQPVSDNYISNKEITVEVDKVTGLLAKITVNGTVIPVTNNMFYYESYISSNSDPDTDRSDGPYMFRPKTNTATPITQAAAFSVYKGDVVEEIHQVFNKWTSQVIRLYKEEYHVEFEWLVGPVQIHKTGVQPISRFTSNLKSDGVFYTDSNGREMLRRQLNHRDSWNVTISQAVAGNYYPVTSRIVVKDEEQDLEIAVLTDRAQGGSSLQDGQIELMLHRRLKSDDGYGVDEFLNDLEPAIGKHYVVVGKSSPDDGTSLSAKQRLLAQRKLVQPWIFLSSDWPTDYIKQYSGLRKPLPDNVQLLTLEPWGCNKVLLRLEHIMEKDDDQLLSKNVNIDLQDIFDRLKVSSVRETTLDGNQWLEDVKKLQWQTTEGSTAVIPTTPIFNGTSISLAPVQIRTFIVEIAKSSNGCNFI